MYVMSSFCVDDTRCGVVSLRTLLNPDNIDKRDRERDNLDKLRGLLPGWRSLAQLAGQFNDWGKAGGRLFFRFCKPSTGLRKCVMYSTCTLFPVLWAFSFFYCTSFGTCVADAGSSTATRVQRIIIHSIPFIHSTQTNFQARTKREGKVCSKGEREGGGGKAKKPEPVMLAPPKKNPHKGGLQAPICREILSAFARNPVDRYCGNTTTLARV